mmetsp:Transcript_61557/g.173891  ORF Transcript_61557/g.173891 Transcript_61557/m.173891 type:complete len:686 (+) Transcript_61557:94-2151(+)
MVRSSLSLLLLLGGALARASAADSARSAVTPVQKVVQLMEGMMAKGKEEKHDEQVQFAAYKQFCDDNIAEKQRAIKEANEKLEVLSADIELHTTDAAKMQKEIAEHEEDITVWAGDQKAATKVREIEKADYDTMHADYSESIDALERAVDVLKQQDYDRKQDPESLMQVASLKGLDLIPESTKRMVDAFLQDEPEGLAVRAPEADAYEAKSGGVVKMLEDLLDKFVAERTTLEKEEMNAKHAYEMLMQDLAAQVTQATADKDEKSEAKAKAMQSKATAEGDFKDTVATRDADEAYLGDLSATCEQKASDFESRQALRAEELEAINKAIEIISGSAVKGNAETYLPSLAQRSKGRATALVSVFMGRSQRGAQARVVEYLQKRSHELSSPILLSLATRVSSDPFERVKKMIKDLIVRLMEEANEEAEHKGWCDTELSTNEQTRKEKTEAVETLHAEIDQLEASISKLTEDISVLSQAVADLDAAMAKATELRQEEKATNEQTIKDSQEAQTAVSQAVTVLKEFYAQAAESQAFLQGRHAGSRKQEPAVFSDTPYQGMSAEKGGVIGMLEVIQSDFARLESSTSAGEATSQRDYDRQMTDNAVMKAQLGKDIEHKDAMKQQGQQALVDLNNDLSSAEKELNAANAYFEKLKPSCVDAGMSFQERAQRRQEEIESLQEAMRILNGEDLA